MMAFNSSGELEKTCRYECAAMRKFQKRARSADAVEPSGRNSLHGSRTSKAFLGERG